MAELLKHLYKHKEYLEIQLDIAVYSNRVYDLSLIRGRIVECKHWIGFVDNCLSNKNYD